MQNHNDTIIKTQENFFRKILYLSFYCKGSKRFVWVSTERGRWRPNINCNILTPNIWPSTLCLSRSPDAQPEAQRPTLLGDDFLYCILSASSPDLNPSRPHGFTYHLSSFSVSNSNWNSSGAPRLQGLMWLYLPHLVPLRLQLYCNSVLTSVLTELYNSSTSTQSPTRSLKSHVWSSSSGNNCHAVHRYSLPVHQSMSVPWEFFYLVPFHHPISAHTELTAIRMCHLLPVHHLGMAFLAGSKVKIPHYFIKKSFTLSHTQL